MSNNSTTLRRGRGGPNFIETEIGVETFKLVDLTVQTPTSQEPPTNTSIPLSPPRWRTLEFRFYGLMFLLVVPLMVYSPVQLSQGELFGFIES
jgi:hypothetical protein